MIDFEFTEEQQAVRRMVAEFVDQEIVPYAGQWDREGKLPPQLLRRLAELGFMGAPLPHRYGGSDMDYVSLAILFEEIGRGCSSVGATLTVQLDLVALTILRFGNDEQKERYLPRLASGEWLGAFCLTEPNVGSDPARMATTAVKEGDRYLLNGNKLWTTNGNLAGLLIVFATLDRSLKNRGITAFLVERDTPGLSTRSVGGKLGHRASDTAEVTLDHCSIPQEQRLGQEREGFKIAMSALDNARLAVAAAAVGVGRACIEACVRYCNEREQFEQKLGNFQMIQQMIADMVVENEAAKLLTYRAAAQKDRGVRNTLETSMAKLFASEASMRAAHHAIQIHGGYGYSEEFPVERYFRDIKGYEIYEGTSQVQRVLIALDALGWRRANG